MKEENIKRKKKIAIYLFLLLVLSVSFALIEVFEVLKSINGLNVGDNTVIMVGYAKIFLYLIGLTVVVILAAVLFVKIISNKE